MLILTRKVGESLMIGDETVVTVLSVRNQQVRVGICAPKDVDVHREEVYERIAAEKLGQPSAAAQLDAIRHKRRVRHGKAEQGT